MPARNRDPLTKRSTRSKRTVGYVNGSTAIDADPGTSLAAQRARVQEYAAAKGWDLLETISEAASGDVFESAGFEWEHRQQLSALIDRAEQGEYSVLLVTKLDSLSHDPATLTILVSRLQRHGVDVVSVAEDNGDDPLADSIRGQLPLVVQLERAMVLERLNAGKARKKALGRHIHGRVAYGYHSKGGVLSANPHLAPVIQRIYTEVAQGRTPGQIAADLNANGIPSPSGAAWTRLSVRRIAANPVYAGERHGIEQAHEAIVTWQAFERAAQALAARRRHDS